MPTTEFEDEPAPALDAAEAVLRANDKGCYTVPSPITYPHQWNWDSALCALGWARMAPHRAWEELETLARARDARGMIPHVAYTPRRSGRRGGRAALAPHPRYLPGPRWWGRRHGRDGRRISALTQPPVAATCLRLVYEEHPDEARARALLRPLHGWHRFLLTARDPEGLGEPVLIHPWESGRDNALEWDEPLARVTPAVQLPERPDTNSVDPAERPSDEQYRRFLTLVREGVAAGWSQERLARRGPFRVLDPGFSAILSRACLDLAWLADELGERRIAEESAAAAARVARALIARADADGLVRPADLARGVPIGVTGAGSALALLAPFLPVSGLQAARVLVLAGPLASPFGIRSLAARHPESSQRNYWRGPVWANTTWLCAHALALHGDDRAATMLRLRLRRVVGAGGMREYFEPEAGTGLGARAFAWTAALTLRVSEEPHSAPPLLRLGGDGGWTASTDGEP
jgi:Glycosyl hydrolase family 63 C-terminal domain